MQKVYQFKTVKDYNDANNHPTLHPLVSVVDLSKAHPRGQCRMVFDIYLVVLKQVKCGDIRFGNQPYDYQEGTLVFFAPGQTIDVVSEGLYQPVGLALAFHPDLVLNTPPGKTHA